MSDLNKGLIVHLLMDEFDENGKVVDVSESKNHGVIVEGQPDSYEEHEAGNCLVFSGFYTQLTLGKTQGLDLFNESFTVAVWVQFYDDVGDYARLLFSAPLEVLEEGRQELEYPFSFGIKNGFVRMSLHPEYPIESEQSIEIERWYHLAFRYDRSSEEQSIFINGICDTQGECPPFIKEWLNELPDQEVVVGDSGPPLFMCDLRCYNRALSDEDIQVIAKPENRKRITVPVNRGPSQPKPFPIEFHLRDNAQQPVLSARSTGGQQLTLEVKNATLGEIQFKDIPSHSTGPDRYHLILRFRKGILRSIDEIKLAAISTDEGWRLDRHHPDQRHDPFDELCFWLEAKKTLSPGEGDSCLITLENVRADGERGTRNSRVELLYQNLVYREQPLTGYRGQTFSVVNSDPPEASEEEKQARDAKLIDIHEKIKAVESNVSDSVKAQLEKYDKQIIALNERTPSREDLDYLSGIQAHLQQLVKDNPDQEALTKLQGIHLSITNLQEFEKNPRGPLPLHIGFDGSNTVLNDKGPASNSDGTKTTLTLKLTALGSHDSIAFGPDSIFVLGFDIATDDQAEAWALCHSSEAESIRPTLRPTLGGYDWKVQEYPTPGHPRYTWTFKYTGENYALLEMGKALTLEITHIHSSMPSGPTNLYLGYENIYTEKKDEDTPGRYKDSQFILQVIKTPLVFGNKNVGIGTTDIHNDNKLIVKGKVKIDGDIKITGKNYLEFGAGVPGKEANAGKIGYHTFSNGLDIVGAGSTNSNRTIKFWSEGGSEFNGPVTIDGDLTLKEKLSHETGTVTIVGDLKVTGRVSDKSGLVIPVGTILPYAGQAGDVLHEYKGQKAREGPKGWLICNGAWVLIRDYTELLAILKGNDTLIYDNSHKFFRLPNLQGRIPVGKNSSTFSKLGNTGGQETHVLTENEMPSHSHNFRAFHANFDHDGGASEGSTKNDGDGLFYDADAVLSKGGDQPHNNLQPYMVVNYIIKY